MITIPFRRTHADQFITITCDLTHLPNFFGRDKRKLDQIMFEEIADPFGIFLICLLAFDGFDILGMSEMDIGLIFKNVKDGDPVFTGRLHTDIRTVMRSQPIL